MPFEILVAGAELAEVGWNAYQHRQEHVHTMEHEDVATERELAYIKHENARLQATVEEYKKALEELQGCTESTERLRHALSSREGTLGVFEQIQKRVDSPEFLEKLVRTADAGAESTKSTVVRTKDGVSVKVDVNDPSWWEWVTEQDTYGGPPKEDLEHSLDGEAYVIIDQDDVINGIADFVAHYLITLPQTEGLPPKELQQLLSQAFTELRKKNSYRRLWDWGRFLYNTACWATTAFGIYRNPIVVRAALVGIWTSSRIILGLFW